jgi:hypothetical protein
VDDTPLTAVKVMSSWRTTSCHIMPCCSVLCSQVNQR